ncbi:ficolin-1-A-like [Pomacea canaliculata]|uniref:ficolin-1-A-like n=1 Tax=Pomacea canaliculata TaxID=400727 RepID=UPI000D72BA81|nr:ficolin-1-A-like [Pomacea canaliculata]
MDTYGGGWLVRVVVFVSVCDSGLFTLHALVEKQYVHLRVDIIDRSGRRRYAEYDEFSMWGADGNYELFRRFFLGDAGDGLAPNDYKGFSTYDRDPTGCVKTRHSAWWYPDDCGSTYLNSPYASGNAWGDFSNLQFSEMKIKP